MAHINTFTVNETFSGLKDSDCMIPLQFCSLNQTNQMFDKNNSAETYNNQTRRSTGKLVIPQEAVMLLKGLMVTRIMPSFYIFVILISLPLNALALVTFTCKIRAKKPPVIYMSHLACVDLLFTLLLPLKIHYRLNASDWVFGEVACRILSVAYYCYMYCSILLMMCISVDRLLAVALPVASLSWRSTRKAICVCILVWLLALAGTAPTLLVRQTASVKNVGVTCLDVMKEKDLSALFYLFSIIPCIYFFLPLVVILVSYSIIIYVLCTKPTKSSSSSDKEKRAIVMATAVLIEFVMCFAPSNGILLYHCVHLATGERGVDTYPAYLLAVCLGSASVFLGPSAVLLRLVSVQTADQSCVLGQKEKKANSQSNTNTQTLASAAQ